MEFNLYKYVSTSIYDKWVRFPAIVLGLGESGIPFVDLWKQEKKVFKDEDSTTVNSDPTKTHISFSEITDPTTETFNLLNPITGEQVGTMTLSDYIAASYSFGIWVDTRNEVNTSPPESIIDPPVIPDIQTSEDTPITP